jgi:hypothetical protein
MEFIHVETPEILGRSKDAEITITLPVVKLSNNHRQEILNAKIHMHTTGKDLPLQTKNEETHTVLRRSLQIESIKPVGSPTQRDLTAALDKLFSKLSRIARDHAMSHVWFMIWMPGATLVDNRPWFKRYEQGMVRAGSVQ